MHEVSTRVCKGNVKLYLRITKHHSVKAYWGSVGIAPHILNLTARWWWSASCTGCFTPWIGGWVGPRANLDAVAKRKILIIVPTGN